MMLLRKRTQIFASPLWCICRCSSTKSGGADSNNNISSSSNNNKSSSEDKSPTNNSNSTSPPSDVRKNNEYSIPTADILRAMKQRDFNAIQTHAAEIVHHKWKEEHSIPALCLLFFLLTWYSVSSARRRVVRSCKATEAKIKEEAEQTLELVGRLVGKWREDVQRADQQLQLILDKNGELTKDIDRMTAALRQCYINAPINKNIQAKDNGQE
ncbi:uncharacterized protein TM35_000441240 [Trypanosoma theileri]|uniref:Uncharacterized protein n=1 Tax=Trypanosoma theileri TaxID=67003 RepID=A0A1X0NIW3_9TRYP|nr:uncharacterized protein TM35_000441240 [Trypanosoma theileri]ORC84468.1 hypothetical protein TM35_000441240 [Trypanosoma theileri]